MKISHEVDRAMNKLKEPFSGPAAASGGLPLQHQKSKRFGTLIDHSMGDFASNVTAVTFRAYGNVAFLR